MSEYTGTGFDKGTLLEDFDLLVQDGVYPDQTALIQDALRSLIRHKPELRHQLALALYKRDQVSLARAAEIAGLDGESFKELLREAGIARPIPSATDTLTDEVSALTRLK